MARKFSREQLRQIGGIVKSALRAQGARRKTTPARDAELVLISVRSLNNQRRVCIRYADDSLYACICPSCNTKESWLTGDGRIGGPPKSIACPVCKLRRLRSESLLERARGYRDDELHVNIRETL